MKLILQRKQTERGARLGSLMVDNGRNEQPFPGKDGTPVTSRQLCGTVEREDGLLPVGEYEVKLARCPLLHRKMIFLADPAAEGEEALYHSRPVVPPASVCGRCVAEAKHHHTGKLCERHAIPCPMMQPGNGPFTLRKGGILVGEAHEPGFVTHSQDIFLLLYNRIKQAAKRGRKVMLVIKPQSMAEKWGRLSRFF